MKKDINLLSAEKQVGGSKKANGVIIGVVAVVLIVGLMTFVLVNTKGKISKLDTDITKLEQDKSFYGPKNEIQDNEYNSATAILNTYLIDLLAEDLLNERIDSVFKIAIETVESIIEQNEVDGITKIYIESITTDELNNNILTFTCKTNNDLDYLHSIEEMKEYQNRLINNVIVLDNNDELILAIKSIDVVDYVFNETDKNLIFTMTITLKRFNLEVAE